MRKERVEIYCDLCGRPVDTPAPNPYEMLMYGFLVKVVPPDSDYHYSCLRDKIIQVFERMVSEMKGYKKYDS